MPKYVIEREIPGAGKLSSQELKGISQKSCGVLSKIGPQIQWLHSYVTGNKIYCIYISHRMNKWFGSMPGKEASPQTGSPKLPRSLTRPLRSSLTSLLVQADRRCSNFI